MNRRNPRCRKDLKYRGISAPKTEEKEKPVDKIKTT
jgi:hypothetical protein